MKKFAGQVLDGIKNFGAGVSLGAISAPVVAALKARKMAIKSPLYGAGILTGLGGTAAGIYGLGRMSKGTPDLQNQIVSELKQSYPEMSDEEAFMKANELMSSMQ